MAQAKAINILTRHNARCDFGNIEAVSDEILEGVYENQDIAV